jgi:preprotein translocase subunit SecE
MANQSVQTVNTASSKLKVALAILAVVAGVVGFYALSAQSTSVRALALVAGIIVAVAIAWTSIPGREFIGFARDAKTEVKKVVWPTRKEAIQLTAIVFVFVLVMAIFLWGTDKVLEFFLYDLILGWK